jgi:hypothetical protein
MITLRKSLSNIIGWKTKRKIVVIESDDWGSIRTRSKDDLDVMERRGLNINANHFMKNDSLESNLDLENLLEVLVKHKDKNDNSAIFTPMSIMANPDFEKIKDDGYNEYFYENFTETYKKYPNSNNVFNLWKEGIEKRLFVPALHGREHINVKAWMDALKLQNKGVHLAFEHATIGISNLKDQFIPEHLASFYPETIDEINTYHTIIKEATKIFYETFNFKASHFVGPNKEPVKILDKTMALLGIQYMSVSKLRKHPLGNGKHGFEMNWLGRKNEYGQIMLTRNCGFEPTSDSNYNWVNSCLQEIENAFFWHKPAIISSHRVNYIGSINPKNAKQGLRKLDTLLTAIIKKWPTIEFMTSMELGELIIKEKNA